MIDESMQLANLGRRLVATAIDFILVPLLTVILVMITDVVEDADDYADSVWMVHVLLLAIVSYLILNGYLLWRRGQTIGKLLLGIQIVRARDGGAAPFWKLVCIRALFFPLLYLVFTGPLAVLPVLDLAFIFVKSGRCLHDLAADTVVITASIRGKQQS